MSTTVEQIAPCRRKLHVEIAPARVAETRTEIIRDIGKIARIPGFRPGKAPQAMVEHRYGKEIEEELRKKLIPQTYQEAVQEHHLKAVGYPEIESVKYEPGQPFVYTCTVDTAPEFELPAYKGIPLKKQPVEIKDEQVEQTVKLLQEQHAEFVDVTGRTVQSGDYAVIHYSGVTGGKPITELVPQPRTLGENQNFWLLVDANSFLPGFCAQLVGAAIGEKRQVQVDFPADFAQKPLAGQKATYFVDVVGLKEKKLPEVNDEFAKKVGAESLPKLREDIRKGLVAERENEVKADLRKQAVDHLLGQIQLDLPESLVQRETKSIVYDLVRENTMRGATKEQLEEKKDEILGFATKSAQDRLRASFVLDRIGEAEKIEVTEPEMEERIGGMAQRYRVTPERLKAQLAEKGGLGEVEEQILVSKTLDFLVANAKVDPASPAE